MPLDHTRTVLIFAPDKSPQNVAVSGKDRQRSILLFLLKPKPVVLDVEVCLEMTFEIGPGLGSDGVVQALSCVALDHKLPDCR